MVMKSRRMGWVGHIAHMGGMKLYEILVGQPERKEHFETWGMIL
jgi:hypothetical protein